MSWTGHSAGTGAGLSLPLTPVTSLKFTKWVSWLLNAEGWGGFSLVVSSIAQNQAGCRVPTVPLPLICEFSQVATRWCQQPGQASVV